MRGHLGAAERLVTFCGGLALQALTELLHGVVQRRSSGDSKLVEHLCSLPAAAQLQQAQITELLEVAVAVGWAPRNVGALLALPGAAELGWDFVRQLLLKVVQTQSDTPTQLMGHPCSVAGQQRYSDMPDASPCLPRRPACQGDPAIPKFIIFCSNLSIPF
jgi:hypothetical protein